MPSATDTGNDGIDGHVTEGVTVVGKLKFSSGKNGWPVDCRDRKTYGGKDIIIDMW